MAAVGAAAPTIFSQWVQTNDNAFCAHNILEQNTLFMNDKHRRSYYLTKFCNALVNSESSQQTRIEIASDTYYSHLYHSFTLGIIGILESLHQSAVSGVRSWTLCLAPAMFQLPNVSYARGQPKAQNLENLK